MLILGKNPPADHCNRDGYAYWLKSVELTINLVGALCDVKINGGETLPNRGPRAFRIKSDVDDPTMIEIESFVEVDGEALMRDGELVMAVESFITPKLVVNGLTIFDESQEKARDLSEKYERRTLVSA